jgi:ABC-type lipoprotein release transport system permease subunit
MPKLRIGLLYASIVLIGQIALAHALEPVPHGTRAQGTGACVTTLLMVIAGFILGIREKQRRAHLFRAIEDVPTAGEDESLRRRALRMLEEALAPWASAPWSQVFASALALMVLGLAGALGLFDPLLPASVLDEGGIARAMWGTDLTFFPAAILIGIGSVLGVNTRPGSVITAFAGFAFFALCSALFAYLARFTSYDPAVIGWVAVAGVGVASFLSGFAVSWARKRLAFVEMAMIALMAGYVVYLAAAVGPPEWTRSSNLPDEQVLLSLAVLPSMGMMALLTVGGSIGFLLFGGGRFDPGFRFETNVGLRYLKAHRRDGFVGIVTIIAVVGVCLGVMALIIVLSIMSGFEDDLKKKILGAHAHVVVGKNGDDFSEYEAVKERVLEIDGVKTAAAFVMGDAMISTDIGLSGTLVKGVDPADRQATAELRKNVVKGDLDHLLDPSKIPGQSSSLFEFPPPTQGTKSSTSGAASPFELAVPIIRDKATRPQRVLPGIIIGRELARTLRAYVGDTVKLVSPMSEEIGPLGPTPKLRRFRVAGIFYSGMYEYDAKFTYISMKEGQRFFGQRHRVDGIEIKVTDVDETSRIVEDLRRVLGGFPYTIKDWRFMNKELFSALLLEKLAMFIALAMIVMVASFLIVATLVMIVLQRGKEIAIMKSLGASDSSIMKIFVVQGLIVGVGGAILGVVCGVVICLLLERFGVRLDEKIFYIEKLPVVMEWGEVSAIAIAAVIISYLATIYPAMTAAQLRPVQGLRDD